MDNEQAIEVQLMRWGESSSSGRTVTFWLPDDPGEHPFKGMTTRSGKTKPGQRFAMALALITDDETTEVVAKPKQSFADFRPSHQAGILCGDANFQGWVLGGGTFPKGVDLATVAAAKVRLRCMVESRKELDTSTVARNKWAKLLNEYNIHSGRQAEER